MATLRLFRQIYATFRKHLGDPFILHLRLHRGHAEADYPRIPEVTSDSQSIISVYLSAAFLSKLWATFKDQAVVLGEVRVFLILKAYFAYGKLERHLIFWEKIVHNFFLNTREEENLDILAHVWS